jgi:hypothetical protein
MDTTSEPFDETPPATRWDRETTRRALDELFAYARQYNSSKECFELLRFVANFRFYSPYNAMLIYTQMKDAKYVAPAHRWMRDYGRRIKAGARAIVILQPIGPVMFVFDVADTGPGPGVPPLPREVEKPFEVLKGRIGDELQLTIENAKRNGVSITERPQGSQSAGSIQAAAPRPTPRSSGQAQAGGDLREGTAAVRAAAERPLFGRVALRDPGARVGPSLLRPPRLAQRELVAEPDRIAACHP